MSKRIKKLIEQIFLGLFLGGLCFFMLVEYGDYVHIHRIGEKSLMKKSSLKAMAERLNNNFIQVHKSYIVNIDCINPVHPYQKASYILELLSAEQIPVSKSGYENIKSYLN